MRGDNVVKFRSNASRPRAEDGPSLVDFLQMLRCKIMQEFERGRDVDQIFADLEVDYMRWKKAQKS
jgi:hypothetical protein